MAQFVENLPDKCEDLSLEPNILIKSQVWLYMPVTPKLGKQRQKKNIP